MLLAWVAVLTACHRTESESARIEPLIAAQCGGCHVVPGIATARGHVGPSLAGIAGRQFLAGTIPNTPRNMQAFLLHPQAMAPGGAMPELGLSPAQADAISRRLLEPAARP